MLDLALKLLPGQWGRNSFALRPVQSRHVAQAAALYRRLASQKRLAMARDLDIATACREVNGDVATTLARFADDVERLELAGIPTTDLLAYACQVAADARVQAENAASWRVS